MALWIYEDLETPNPMFTHGFHIDLNIQDDLTLINGYEFKLSDVLARSDYYPMSRFVFPYAKVWHESNEYISGATMPFNVFGFTETTSLKTYELAHVLKQSWPVQVIFYPETTNFSNALWLATVDKSVGITVNIEAEQVIPPTYVPMKGAQQINWSPKCVVTGPTTIAPDQTAILEFEYRDRKENFVACNFPCYLKTTGGYLPKTLVPVVDGRCSVEIQALGLKPGDQIDIKFGLGKVYSSAVVHTLTVV